MKWTDISEIAILLSEKYPDADVVNMNFVELREMVVSLEEFDDDPERTGERILEAIQQAWIDEQD